VRTFERASGHFITWKILELTGFLQNSEIRILEVARRRMKFAKLSRTHLRMLDSRIKG